MLGCTVSKNFLAKGKGTRQRDRGLIQHAFAVDTRVAGIAAAATTAQLVGWATITGHAAVAPGAAPCYPYLIIAAVNRAVTTDTTTAAPLTKSWAAGPYTTHSLVGYVPLDVASLRVRYEQLTRLDFHQLYCSLVGCSGILYFPCQAKKLLYFWFLTISAYPPI